MLQSTGSFFFAQENRKRPLSRTSSVRMQTWKALKRLRKGLFPENEAARRHLVEFEKRFAPFKVTICAPCEGLFLKKAV